MAKKPNRTWAMVASLGVPLAIVGISAMAISYATLIDVAKVNGLPLPQLYPVLVDVGTVATMIAAAQMRMRGVPGRWLAYTTFVLLSVVSIVANASHAWRAADLAVTTPWAAAILASTPPATLLAITHLVMMLIPDEKERAKLHALKEKASAEPVQRERTVESQSPALPRGAAQPQRGQLAQASPASRGVAERPLVAAAHASESRATVVPVPVRDLAMSDTLPVPVVSGSPGAAGTDKEAVKALVLEYTRAHGKRPTGKIVAEWMGGLHPKSGQRLLREMLDAGAFDAQDTELAEALESAA